MKPKGGAIDEIASSHRLAQAHDRVITSAFYDRRNGVQGQFAQQQSETADVRFGSKADIAVSWSNVRFTPESGH
jgi:hypothetical protein